ncbi:tetratricopeptide repeat protein [Clostridium paridis]|uniref:Tetratricopeptide repeat protein n=1 Tax=Clostridium paridis TaxID=2803863 RepID=A0A937K4H0_9CLOT|nr:tetratricopeptide repeat protein [Clostridium paridis]MBL4931200.1 hypothetical protein [Clostridium paridis]
MKKNTLLSAFSKLDGILLVVVLIGSFLNPILGTVLGWGLVVFLIIEHRDGVAAFLGNYYYHNKKYSKAINWYKTASKIKGTNIKNVKNYVFLEINFGSIDEAEANLKVLIEKNQYKDNNLIEIKLTEAMIYWKKDDLNRAIEVLRPLMNDLNSSAIHGTLGYLLNYSDDLDEALSFNLNANTLYPEDIFIKSNLAQSYYFKKDFNEASKLLDMLLESHPRFPEPYYFKAMILKSEGLTKEAFEMFDKAYKMPAATMSYVTKERIKEDSKDVNPKYNNEEEQE